MSERAIVNLNAKDLLIRYKTILILIVLILFFFFLNQVFLDPTNIMNMLKRMTYVGIAGFGVTFIITLGGLDISVGSVCAVEGVVLAMMFRSGIPVVAAVVIAVLMCLGLGWTNGAISVKGKIEPFLVTLATMNIFRGIAMTLCAGRPIPIRVPGFADVFGNGKLFGFLPTPVVFMIGFFILTIYLYHYSKFGFYIRAIGGNIEAARVAGLAVDRIKMFAYTLSGLYSAMAGLILASLMNAGMSDIGSDLALDAIAAVILGGTAISGGRGSIWGTLGGALIMGVLNSGLSLLGAQAHQQVLAKGIVIILAVLMSNIISRKS